MASLKQINWEDADEAERTAALQRAPVTRCSKTRQAVSDILLAVSREGDTALRRLTLELDGVDREQIQATANELATATEQLDPVVKEAIDKAATNIESFHRSGVPAPYAVETTPGVTCQTRFAGMDRVGLYAPGGATPLPSSVLMMAIPARLAECRHVLLCTPPDRNGKVNPAIAYAAERCGVDAVYLVGGAQAIAGMGMGTDSIPRCDKLFGPGSVWVTEAKRQIGSGSHGVAIDMPAGPSEVMIVADETASAEFVALDMAAQLEHGPDSQALLVATDPCLIDQVGVQLDRLASTLSRGSVIREAMNWTRGILVPDLNQGIAIANQYAAEHLIIQTANPDGVLEEIRAAGSVFLGSWTPEVLGDYCSGTNHVLPTSGFARSVNGLSVIDFMKRITVQHASPGGLRQLAATATRLAEYEGLTAHARAVSRRIECLDTEVAGCE